jgi:DNA-binding transcriptional LysR family regulator
MLIGGLGLLGLLLQCLPLRLAALRGADVCQFPTFVVADDIKAGLLIDLLPDWSPKAGIIHALFPTLRGLL